MPNPQQKAAPKKNTKNISYHTLLLLITIAFISSVIISIFLIGSFKENKAKNEKDQVNLSKDIFKSRYAFLYELKEDKEKVSNMEIKYQQQSDNLLSDAQSISRTLDDITSIGEKEQLKFILFKPDKAVEEEFHNIMPVNITVIGKFQNIKSFIKKISEFKHLLIIKNLSMNVDKQQSGDIYLTLTLNIFYKKALPKK